MRRSLGILSGGHLTFRISPLMGSSAKHVQQSDQQSSSTLGDYELLEKLGQGGMGTVYRARHLRLGKNVAIKVLPAGLTDDAAAISRFQREMLAVGQLEHPNIVQAHDAREEVGTHFLVMQLVGGIDLAALSRRCGPLQVADACEIIRQAASGLQHAFEHGLVHRDIKPSNLLLSHKGIVKILDMGLALLQEDDVAELTTTGQIMGTFDYIAPEQIASTHNVDIRADLYSLGCTLYKLLTGTAPFAGANYTGPLQKMRAHEEATPLPLGHYRDDIPPGLIPILDRLLAKNPADRFDSPAELAAGIAPLCAGSDLVKLVRELPEETPMPAVADPDVAPPAVTASHVSKTGLTETILNKTVPSAPTEPEPVLDEPRLEETAPEIITSGTDTAQRVLRRRQSQRPPWKPILGFAALVLLVIGGVYGGQIIRVVTGKGLLVIEADDRDIEVTISRDSDGSPATIVDKATDRTYTLAMADDYRVTITEPATGQTFTSQQFTITRGGRKVFDVRALQGHQGRGATNPLEAPQPRSPSDSEDERKIAEWVLSIGGGLQWHLVDNPYDNVGGIKAGDHGPLPDQPFTVRSVLFDGNRQVTDDDLARLEELSDLRQLQLSGTNIGTEGLRHVAQCRSLQTLYLDRSAVTNAGLASITQLPLKQLNADLIGLTEKGLEPICRIKTLESLAIASNDLSSLDLGRLSALPALSGLSAHNSNLNDDDLPELLELRNLRGLHLGNNRITDDGLATLAQLTKLETLQLGDNDISDTGIAALSALTHLQELHLLRTQVTSAGVEPLHQALPGCRILWDGGTIEPASIAKSTNYALAFDGVDDYVTFNESLQIDPDQPMTLEAWVRVDRNTGQGDQTILSCPPHHLGVRDTKSKWQHLVWSDALHSEQLATVRGSRRDERIHFGEFTHLASVWQGNRAGGRLQLYVDGGLVDTFELTEPLQFTDFGGRVESLGIEQIGDQQVNPFAGAIDELRISNVVRYTDDFTPAGRFEPDEQTLALYHFNEGRGTVLKDAAAGGHDGTIRGATWVRVEPASDYAQQRRVAEWVLNHGGSVILSTGAGPTRSDRRYSSITELPASSGYQLEGVLLESLGEIADEEMSKLASLMRETPVFRLSLAHTAVSDASLSHLAGTDITKLALNRTAISDKGLEVLPDIRSLQHVELGGTQVTDAGLQSLLRVSGLEILDLRNSGVTDSGMADLAKISKLDYLILNHTAVTDNGALSLAACPNLRTLYVEDTAITKNGVAVLRSRLPGCRILWDGGTIEPAFTWSPGTDEQPLHGLIARPAKLDGIKRWQVETITPRSPILDAEYSPDGQLLACLSSAGHVRLMDAETLQLTKLWNVTGGAIDLDWSPDGNRLAVCVWDRPIQVFDREGRLVREIDVRGHRSIEWDPTGTRLAIGEQDRKLHLYTWDDEQVQVIGEEAPADIVAVRWSSDAAWIAVGRYDGSIQLYTPDGVAGAEIDDFDQRLEALEWSPDGKRLAAVFGADVRLWDAAGQSQGELLALKTQPHQLTWGPDSHTLVVGGNNAAVVWDIDQNSVETSPSRPNYTSSLAWRPGTDEFVRGDVLGQIEVMTLDGTVRVATERYQGVGEGLAISPAGDRIVAACHDGSIRLWDRSGRVLRSQDAHRNLGHAAAWNVDGSQFATVAADNTIRTWTAAGEPLRTERGEQHQFAVAWHPREQVFAARGHAAIVRIWGPEEAPLQEIPAERASEQYISLAFSPDGRHIAADAPHGAWVWDYVNGAIDDGTRRLLDAGVSGDIAWRPDGQALAVADTQVVRIIGLDGTILSEFRPPRSNLDLVWSPDGNAIALAGHYNGEVPIYSPDGERLLTLSGPLQSVYGIDWSDDAAWIAAGDSGCLVHVWDAETGEHKWVGLQLPDLQNVSFTSAGQIIEGEMDLLDRELICLVEHPDGHTELLKPSEFQSRYARDWSEEEVRNRRSTVWQPGPAEEALPGIIPRPAAIDGIKRWQVETTTPRSGITCAQYSPDGEILACTTEAGRIRLLDAETLKPLALCVEDWPVHRLAWSPDGRRFAASVGRGRVTLFSREGVLERQTELYDCYGLDWDPAGDRLAVGNSKGTLLLYSWAEDQVSSVTDAFPSQLHHVAWSPDGEWIATGCGDGIIRLYKPDGTAGPVLNGFGRRLDSLVWASDGKRLAALSNRTIRVWTADGAESGLLEGAGGAPAKIVWAADNQTLVIGGLSHQSVWDTQSEDADKLPQQPDDSYTSALAWRNGHDEFARCDVYGGIDILSTSGERRIAAKRHRARPHGLEIRPQGDRLASVGWNGSLRMWDNDGRLLVSRKSHNGWGHDVTWTSDGERFATASTGGLVHIWNSNGDPLQELSTPGDYHKHAVTWNPAGDLLAARGEAAKIHLWVPEQIEAVELSADHGNMAFISLAFSPDGRRLAADAPQGLWLWESNDGGTFSGDPRHIEADIGGRMAWRPDGEALALVHNSDCRIIQPDGMVLSSFGLPGSCYALDWSPGGDALAFAGAQPMNVHVMSPEGEQLRTLNAQRASEKIPRLGKRLTGLHTLGGQMEFS